MFDEILLLNLNFEIRKPTESIKIKERIGAELKLEMGETDARRREDTFVKKKKTWEDILNELRLPTKNGLQRQKRGRQERNIHLFSPVLQAYT